MSEMISPRKSGVVGTDVRSAANPHEAGNRLRLRYLKDLNAQKSGVE